MIDLTSSVINPELSPILKMGTEFYIDIANHDSVGTTSIIELQYCNIVKFINAELLLNNPDCDVPGGDEGIKRYYFQAISKGKVVLELQKFFRGELESTVPVKITIT